METTLGANLGVFQAEFQKNLDGLRVCSRAGSKIGIAVVLSVLSGVIDRSGVVGVCLLAQFGSLVGCVSPPSQSSHRNYYSWSMVSLSSGYSENLLSNPGLSCQQFLRWPQAGNQKSWEMTRS